MRNAWSFITKGRGYQTEQRRRELLAQEQAYRDALAESEQAAEAASRAEQPAPRIAGYPGGEHPAPPPGRA